MFRYEVPIDDRPHGFKLWTNPVAVAEAGNIVEFWALGVEGEEEQRQDAKPLLRHFQVFGTGHELPSRIRWFGTCARSPEGLVWHLFEVETP